MSSIQKVGIVGSGQMGGGIAQVFATGGFETFLWDAASEQLQKGKKSIEDRLARLVEKEKLTASEKEQALSRLRCAGSVKELGQCDLVIEAIIERFETKVELLKELDSVCGTNTILASNTSSISITKLASVTKCPDRVIGLHFMNPVPVMQLVEIIRGLQTSDLTYDLSKAVITSLGKIPVTARMDYPGFIVNRILIPMLNEACFVLMEGIATPEEIDTAMKLGTNQPMGPLELADFVGLDTCLAICQIFHREFGDSKYRPCPLLVKYVEAGWYGRKTGRGFYAYANGVKV